MRTNWYHCDICGCYLDPNEGFRCDECRSKLQHRENAAKRFLSTVSESLDEPEAEVSQKRDKGERDEPYRNSNYTEKRGDHL